MDEQTYAANAAKLRNMRLRGEYGSYAKGKKMADDKYYSKRNPHGPYAGATRPSDPAPKPSDHTEGFPTDKNLKQWKDYSLRNSDDPSIKQSK